jgi:2-oxoglutarate ferredoxin oxidoreductase subunit alpha
MTTLNKEKLDSVTIRFVGDSGDGMQLTGNQFTSTSAMFGNDISTYPNFPAEIRAPQGTLAGVSGFQIRISANEIHTPGDELDVLVAMNPAALKTNIADLKQNGFVFVNQDDFNPTNLAKAGYDKDADILTPLKSKYRVVEVPLSTMTVETLKDTSLTAQDKERCTHMFALG